MVQIVTISKSEMLEKYVRLGLQMPINVNNWEGKNWIVALTAEGQAKNPDHYIVVRCEN